MFDLIKPGYVLRFGVSPSTIHSPPGGDSGNNDNTLITPWPNDRKHLGVVRCLSHVTGALEPICAIVATSLRTEGSPRKRAISYSAFGSKVREITGRQNVQIGQVAADFVGYVDGKSMSLASEAIVFSKDFSGCLMAVYQLNGHRYVAHVAASLDKKMDCKQAFLDTLRHQGATLVGWFQPYHGEDDLNRKLAAFAVITGYVGGAIDKFVTFGVVDGNRGYTIDAFRPVGSDGMSWVVTYIAPKPMSQEWTVDDA
jgi:hypothetical protein